MNKRDVLRNVEIWLRTQSDNTDFGVYPTNTRLTIVTPKEYDEQRR